MSEVQLNVFISYSRADSVFVDHLQGDLTLHRFHVWVDRDKIEGGDEWQRKIASEILRCHIVLVVLSREAASSRWVREEVNYAQSFNKLIIPLLYRDVAKPFGLTLLHHIDFTGPYTTGLDALVKRLNEVRTSVLSIDSEADQQAAPLWEIQHPSDTLQSPTDREVIALYNEARTTDDLGRQYELYQKIANMQNEFNHDYIQQRLIELPGQITQQRQERLLASARAGEAASDWRAAVGAWQSLCAMEPENQGYRDALVDDLRKAAEDAYDSGLWLEEMDIWHALQGLLPGDQQAEYHLQIAEQNEKSQLLYRNAYELLEAGKEELARQDLELLKKLAPNYSDHFHIASRLGAEPLMTFLAIEDRRLQEDEQRLRDEEERRHREEEIRSAAMLPTTTLVPVSSRTPPPPPKPKPVGFWRHPDPTPPQPPVLSQNPQFAIPRKTLFVGEPFLARVTFTVQRDVLSSRMIIWVTLTEGSTRMERVTKTGYRTRTETEGLRNRDTSRMSRRRPTYDYGLGARKSDSYEKYTYTVREEVPVARSHVIMSTDFPGGAFKAGEKVTRDAQLRVPIDAMHTFAQGQHTLRWHIYLSLVFDDDAPYSFSYEFQVAPKVYR